MTNTQMEPDSGHWACTGKIVGFVAQFAIATIGAMLLGVLVVLLPTLLFASLTRSPNETVRERVVTEPLLRWGADNPYFGGPILVAFILGWISRRYFKSRVAAWVWVPMTLALLWNITTWRSYSPLSHWGDVRANFFTSDCGDSDCLYEMLVTGPFYTSVAYSLGWIGKTFTRRRGT